MNKVTRNLLILILTSSLLLVCLVLAAAWIMQNPGNLLQQSDSDLQSGISFTELFAATPKPYERPETRGGTLLGSKIYDISETVYIKNTRDLELSQLKLIIALINEIRPFQEVLKMEIHREYTEIFTDQHANSYVVFNLGDVPPGTVIKIDFNYRLRVNEIEFNTGDCKGNLPNVYINSEQMIESDAPQIIELAEQLSNSSKNVCEISRDFYSYIGQSFDYQLTDNDRGALWMINNKIGDCTGFSETQIALSRSVDIPARFIEGLVYLGDGNYYSSELKHNWAEIYLPDNGWVPVDPTWGSLPGQEELFFAHSFSDRVILTYSRYLESLGGHHEYALDYTWLGDEEPLPLEHYVIWGFKLVSD